jgi:plasmid maintenance system antidote protein VapI
LRVALADRFASRTTAAALPPYRTVRDILDRNHLSHADFARYLGVSRSYRSQLVNHRRALSPALGRDLLASRYRRGLAGDVL